MKFKVNISLSLKVTIIVIILSAVSIFSVLYINIAGLDFIDLDSLEEDFAESYYHKSHAVLQGLDNSIETSENLDNKEFVQQKITDLINHSYNEINQIEKLSVNKYDFESKKLIVFASTENESIGDESSLHYIDGVYCNIQSYKDEDVFYIMEHEGEKDGFRNRRILVASRMGLVAPGQKMNKATWATDVIGKRVILTTEENVYEDKKTKQMKTGFPKVTFAGYESVDGGQPSEDKFEDI